MFALSSDLRVGKLASVHIVFLGRCFPARIVGTALLALSEQWAPLGSQLLTQTIRNLQSSRN
jgi:hypothetical protein